MRNCPKELNSNTTAKRSTLKLPAFMLTCWITIILQKMFSTRIFSKIGAVKWLPTKEKSSLISKSVTSRKCMHTLKVLYTYFLWKLVCRVKFTFPYFNLNFFLIAKSEEKKNRTKEEKQQLKLENEEMVKEFGWCIIDGHKQRIGNFKIEPPGIIKVTFFFQF